MPLIDATSNLMQITCTLLHFLTFKTSSCFQPQTGIKKRLQFSEGLEVKKNSYLSVVVYVQLLIAF
jgi:hypothetical protein